jgi:hypothetical protein
LSPLYRNIDLTHVFAGIQLAVNVLGERGNVVKDLFAMIFGSLRRMEIRGRPEFVGQNRIPHEFRTTTN